MAVLPAFHEVSFPISIALGATGGPERRTEVVTLASGREVRNSRWADSRRRYDVGSGMRTADDLALVLAFSRNAGAGSTASASATGPISSPARLPRTRPRPTSGSGPATARPGPFRWRRPTARR